MARMMRQIARMRRIFRCILMVAEKGNLIGRRELPREYFGDDKNERDKVILPIDYLLHFSFAFYSKAFVDRPHK